MPSPTRRRRARSWVPWGLPSVTRCLRHRHPGIGEPCDGYADLHARSAGAKTFIVVMFVGGVAQTYNVTLP